MTRTVSIDRKTLTVSADSPQISGLDLRCTQADLADDSENARRRARRRPARVVPAHADRTADRAARGRDPWHDHDHRTARPPREHTTGHGMHAALARPVLVSASAVRGIRKVAARLICSSGCRQHANDVAGSAMRASPWRDPGDLPRAAHRRHVLRCSVTAANADGSKVAASRILRIR